MTGKFTPADLDHPVVRPEARIDTVADLPDLIRTLE